jgi:hypothetical protein
VLFLVLAVEGFESNRLQRLCHYLILSPEAGFPSVKQVNVTLLVDACDLNFFVGMKWTISPLHVC